MPNIGIWEMLLIFGIVVFLFGAKKIPEIAKSMGTGIKEFKKSLTTIDDEEVTEEKIEEKQPETTQTNP